MTSRPTYARIRTLPVVIAFLINFTAPALNVVAPSLPGPLALKQTVQAASDPVHVGFTLEGCRLPAGDTLPSSLVCDDADYTTGNLGKSWNELDLVPHRLTTDLGTQDDATTTYTMGVAADNFDGGHPGYDVLTAPVVNSSLSDASCQISAGAETIIDPGVGGTDKSIGRQLTITHDKGTTCVFDWVERLALGSHLFPGSSLHTNRTNQVWSTSGIGAADVSIPVKEILPQEISKDMSATRGQAYSWEVSKEANPTSLSFQQTCDDTAGARAADVEITITWTRSGPTGSGDTTITTHVFATNPAHRTITVTPTDKIYEGADQSVLLDTAVGAPVDVPALSTDYLILTHTFTYSGNATHFNDIATATYIDKITGIPVPGQTSATAEADTTASQDPAANTSAVITDTESISGAHLSFSVAAPSVGSFVGYTAGDSTTGPVGWSSGSVSGSGSVTFTKTVSVDEPAITSGQLTDTATVTGDGQQVLASANLSVPIASSASVSLTIDKSIPSDALRLGESVTFDFDITGPNNFSDSASITFAYGDPTSKSTTLLGLAPGTYTVSEQPKANWATQQDKETTISLPACSGSVSFQNSELAPDLSASKTADGSVVNAGEQIGFTVDVSNSAAAGTGIAKDVEISDPLPAGPAGNDVDWSIDPAYAGPGTCGITGPLGAETLHCLLGDLGPGDSASVHVVSDTTKLDCATYQNVASVTASNHTELNPEASTTVECPGLNISKIADTTPIDAGETASYTVVVWNAGPATALNASWSDELPHGVTWSIDLQSPDGDDACASSIDLAGNQSASCQFGDLPPSSMQDGKHIVISGETDRQDCAGLDNTAFAFADNSDTVHATAFIEVRCPTVAIEKVNNQPAAVLPGTTVAFTLTVSVSDGPAKDVKVVDTLPAGYDDPSSISDGGVWDGTARTITWELGDLANGDHQLTYQAAVSADAQQGDTLVNVAVVTSPNSQCPDEQTLADECDDDSTVTVRVPTLVIDKSADTETVHFKFDTDGSLLSITPAQVTWTLTYTLANGPVTDAVITDPLPDFLTFVSASDGGTFAADVITWHLGTLTTGGSVSFVTTVDPAAPETDPILNIATIDSNETPPDTGQDSITITSEQVEAGTSSPSPSTPNTALGYGPAGQPIVVPVELMALLFLLGIGSLAFVNVRAARRRR